MALDDRVIILIYICIFTISSIFAILGEFANRRRATGLSYLASGCAVFSTSIINWIRDSSIGTDVETYGDATFNAAVNSSDFKSFYDYCEAYGIERGYTVLNYLISMFTDNQHIFYLLLGILVNGLFYCSVFLLRDVVSSAMAWILYLLLIFPSTLNLLRQGLALSIVMLAIVMAMKGKSIYCSLLLLCLACVFHKSAIISVILIFTVYFYKRAKTSKMKILTIAIFLVATLMIIPVINITYSHGYLSDKYAQYVIIEGESHSMVNAVLVRAPFALLALCSLLRNWKHAKNSDVLLWLFVVGEFLLLPLQSISVTVGRIMLYYSIFKVCGYVSSAKLIHLPRSIMYPLIVLYAIICFYIQIVVNGSNEIYPFIIASDSIF